MKPLTTRKETFMMNMNFLSAENIFDALNDIDDFFLHEAETANVSAVKAARRKRIVTYSVAGAAGLAVSVGLAMAYWKRSAAKVA